ncbi:LAME_0D03840g1_1 [Lachancea meyersii CBS 8951]|uniref:Peptide hydrolase n=1 Tax=Lachancea meyersii CBS 8951 TaxID=1266667 RepID=A0A1G4J7U1_9SACH|nr:LAME_0D03840g1_1 [Lachancea meyersii CBS 8951]
MRLDTLFSLVSWLVPHFWNQELRTIQVSQTEVLKVTDHEKLLLKRQGVNFLDITSFPALFKSEEGLEVPEYLYPTELVNGHKVTEIVQKCDTNAMYDDLAFFTSFYTRYYKSLSGFESATWLSEKLRNVTILLGDRVAQFHVDHHDWKQFSIIVQIKGTETPENVIVFGSHQDSMNLLFPSTLPAPGADDNGSGTVTNIEALRIYAQYLNETQDWPRNTVEFHFYSAEEGGLLGSLDIFTHYAQENRTVVAMLQQDMTGYVQNSKREHVGVITDFTSSILTDFIKRVIDKYLDIPFIETKCGYACSDHSSASKNGYPAALVIESEFSKTNKYIHTTMDTLDRLNFEHMAEHVKLIIGTTVELGNWRFQKKR